MFCHNRKKTIQGWFKTLQPGCSRLQKCSASCPPQGISKSSEIFETIPNLTYLNLQIISFELYQSIRVWFAWGQSLVPSSFSRHSRPVNLHPLFLFWKHGSVCELDKIGSKIWGAKNQGWTFFCHSKKKAASFLFE